MLDPDLLRSFPRKKKRINFLLDYDPKFKEIFEDYALCDKKLKELLSTSDTDLTRMYSDALEDLRTEILTYLTEESK